MNERVPIKPRTPTYDPIARLQEISPSRPSGQTQSRTQSQLSNPSQSQHSVNADLQKIERHIDRRYSGQRSKVEPNLSPGHERIKTPTGKTLYMPSPVDATRFSKQAPIGDNSNARTSVQPMMSEQAKHTSEQAKHTSAQARQDYPTPAIHKNLKFSDTEIKDILSTGYINIPNDLWEFIPAGSRLRFFKKGSASPAERFRPGGFVKQVMKTRDDKYVFQMETIKGGNPRQVGYVLYPMAYSDLQQVWKQYPRDSFVEIHMIYMSLAKKNAEIKDLVKSVSELKQKVSELSK